MRPVKIIGTAQLPVRKQHTASLRRLGAEVIGQAIVDAGLEPADIDAVYASNMLADELQSQKHIAALLADESGLVEIEALEVRAATAAGAGALRLATLAIGSGLVDIAVVVGVEKMSAQVPTQALAKALDADREVPDGATMVSQSARLLALYLETTGCPADGLAHFAVNAHHNAGGNPLALFREKQVTVDEVLASRYIVPPLRLYDCSPICDGAAAVVLAAGDRFPRQAIHMLASNGSTDRFRRADRPRPLDLAAAARSTAEALSQAGLRREDIDFFELHDAFSIVACLSLEAAGFAAPGQGWRLAADGEIGLQGKIPISTRGGLKARGHPIGATALYQICDIVAQLNGTAGDNQLPNPRIGLMQSVGGLGTTVLTHVVGRI